MQQMSPMLHAIWGHCFWMLLVTVELFAWASPSAFRSLENHGVHWFDSSNCLARLDKQIDVARLAPPYCRYLRAVVIATIVILCFPFSDH